MKPRILLPAITVTFGLQLWRVLVPLLVNVLRNRFGWSAVVVGSLTLAVLLAGFLAGPLQRRLGRRRALVLAAGGTGFLRLAMQAWTGDPAVELGLALAGSVLFTLAVVTLAGRGRGQGGRFAVGVLLGLALDLGLHGFWRTYDLSWQGGAGALLVTGVLFLAQIGLLAQEGRRGREEDEEAAFSPAVVWMGLGPFFVLALLAGQNVARLTVTTGWAQATVFVWMAAGQAMALGGAPWLARRAPAKGRTTAIVGLGLLYGGLLPAWPAGIWAATGYLLAHAGGALALVGLLRGLSAGGGRASGCGVGLAQGATAVLFAGFVYVYHFYGGDSALPSPFGSRLLPLLPAALLAIAVVGVSRPVGEPAPTAKVSWRPALLAVALLALPLFRLATAEGPGERAGRFPLRVMTYNIHAGFDTEGHLGLEALAAVIEAEEPDVVMLQEVSRGLVIYSPTDTLAWLAQRLGMHTHFAPTADALWGLGILSRFPMVAGGGAPLPPENLLIRRGVEWAVVDVGEDGRLTVVNNHFHHPEVDGEVRVLQAAAVVEGWQRTAPLIVGGDLNARPETPEIGLFVEAGWRDVVGVHGPRPGFTFSSTDLYERIDYLWLSPDLTAAEVTVPFSTASDHLPVVATVWKRGAEGRR